MDGRSKGVSPIITLQLQNDKPVITVWPNPATSQIVIANNDKENIYTRASIFDLTGKIMMETKLETNSTKIAIDKFPPGVYIVKLEGDKETAYTQKFIKQ